MKLGTRRGDHDCEATAVKRRWRSHEGAVEKIMKMQLSNGIVGARVLSASGLALLALSAGLALFSLASCKSEPIDPSPQGVYQAQCQRCHEVDGSSTTASKLADEEIDLRDVAFQNGITDERIRRIARYGVGKMQGIPGITGEQLDSVVVYVRILRQDPPLGDPSLKPPTP